MESLPNYRIMKYILFFAVIGFLAASCNRAFDGNAAADNEMKKDTISCPPGSKIKFPEKGIIAY